MQRLLRPSQWQTIWKIIVGAGVILGILASTITILAIFGPGSPTPNPSATATTAAQLAQSTATSSLPPTATATLAPTVPPTSTPTPCNPGAVCYTADFSRGIDSWGASGDWKVANGLLINTGANQNPCNSAPTLTLPYQPTTPDYSVIVQAQFPNVPNWNNCFDIFARVGQTSGQASQYIAFVGDSKSICIGDGSACRGGCCYAPGNYWHTYTFDVKGTDLNFYADGGLLVTTQDATLLGETGKIGLANVYDLLYIRSIVVKGL